MAPYCMSGRIGFVSAPNAARHHYSPPPLNPMSLIRFLASTTALALLLLVPPSAHGTLHLTEFMADNGDSTQE